MKTADNDIHDNHSASSSTTTTCGICLTRLFLCSVFGGAEFSYARCPSCHQVNNVKTLKW